MRSEGFWESLRGNVWKVAHKRKSCLRAVFHTLPLCYLRAENFRACARKNYATVEIHLNALHYSSFLLLTKEDLNHVTRQGGYPLSRNFHGRTGVRAYGRTHVNLTREKKNRGSAWNGKSRVNVKVQPRPNFTFKRGHSYIAYILFTHVKFTCVRTWKFGDSGNP